MDLSTCVSSNIYHDFTRFTRHLISVELHAWFSERNELEKHKDYIFKVLLLAHIICFVHSL